MSDNTVVTENTVTNIVEVTSAGPAGPPGGSLTIQDNGVSEGLLTDKLNFAGSTVSVNNDTVNEIATVTVNAATPGANANITSMTGVTGGISSPDFIQFDTAAGATGAVGRMLWNDTDGTLEFQMKGGNVTLQVGQEEVVRVTNQYGSTISDGQAVYITGSTGNHLNVTLAQANSEATSSKTLAVVAESIANNGTGFATTSGLIRNLNTSALTEGAAIWLSPTVPGGLTSTKPVAPNHAVLIGWCVKQHATVGVIYVHIANGYELEELHNVLITSVANNQVLRYDSATSLWKNATISPTVTLAGAVTGSGTLTDLGNVTITTTATSDPTLTLSGDASGSATFTNLGDATLTVTVADNSHDHTIANVTGLQTTLDLKAPLASPTFTGSVTLPSSTAIGTVSSTEIGYLDGVTSAIQTQIDTKLASASYTAADVLTKIKTVDGSGSGLDADLLDGQDSAYYTAINDRLGYTAENAANKGIAGGYASLDGGGTVPTSQLPAAVLGAVKYQGTWNASTNSPALTSSVGTQGYYYVVSVAGSTNLNGITDWVVGDWAIYNGSVWQKIDNTDAVTSVAGRTGAVTLSASDVSGLATVATSGAISDTTGTLAVGRGGTGATSLTSGYLVKGNGTSAASASVVYDNGTNVGIGTSSPSAKLTVSSGDILLSNAYSLKGRNAADTLSIGMIRRNASDQVAIDEDGYGTIIGFGGVLGVFGSGNVGIGTSSPGTKLDVRGTINASDGTNGNVRAYVDGTAAYLQSLNQAANAYRPLLAMGSTVSFANNGVTNMTLDSSGNLGLGVTPSAWSTAGSSHAFEMGAGNLFSYSTSEINIGQNNYWDGVNYIYKNTAAASKYGQNSGVHTWYTAPSGTAGNAISFTQAMTLDASGNLGVGTSSPGSFGRIVAGGFGYTSSAQTGFAMSQSTDLGVIAVNSIYTSDNAGYPVTYFKSQNALVLNTNTSNPIVFQTNNTERMRITSAGDVGIGTSSPLAKFNVEGGDVLLRGGKYFVGPTAGGNGAGAIRGSLDGVLGSLIFQTENASAAMVDVMTLDGYGNMALGMTPSAWWGGRKAFQIGGGGTTGEAHLASSPGTANYLELGSNSYVDASVATKYISTGAATMYQQYNGAHNWYIAPSGSAGATVSWTQAMTLDASGNLGIGNATVPGNATNRVVLIQGSDTGNLTVTKTGAESGGINAYAGSIWVGSDTNNPLLLKTNGTERARIDTSGNLLVGGTTAFGKISLQGDTNSNLDVWVRNDNAGSSARAGLVLNASGNTWRMGMGSSANNSNALTWTVDIGSANTEMMRLTTGGNLGLGVTPSGTDWATWLYVGAATLNPGPSYDRMELSQNYVRVGSADKYIANGYATQYRQISGEHQWRIAGSGSAGGTITFTQAMTLDASGNLIVNNGQVNSKNTALFFGDGLDNSATVYATGGPVKFCANATERARIDSSGNLLVGTTSAAFGAGSGAIVQRAGVSTLRVNNSTDTIAVELTADTTSAVVSARGNFPIRFTQNSTERMQIDSSGNLLVGTTSALGRLTVAGGYAFVTDDGTRRLVMGPDGTGTLLGTSTNHYLRFITNDTERARIDSSGNLLVGTTTVGGKVSISIPSVGAYNEQTAGWNVSNGTGAMRLWIANLNYAGVGANEPWLHSYQNINIGSDANIAIKFISGGEKARIDSSGNLLVGTTSAAAKITIGGGSGANRIAFVGATGSQYVGYDGVNDALQVASNTYIVFQSGSGYNERARIDSSGNLLVGTTTNINSARTFIKGSADAMGVQVGSTSTAQAAIVFYDGSGDYCGQVQVDPSTNTTSYITSSDYRLKENIADADDAANLIDAIQVRKFDWKADGSHQRYGMVAQELLEVAPEAVSVPADEEAMMGVDYSKLVPMLIKEVQSLRARVAQLEGK